MNHTINDKKSSHSSIMNKKNNIHKTNAHICIHQKTILYDPINRSGTKCWIKNGFAAEDLA